MSESFLSRLEDRLSIHQQPLKERIMHVMYRLRVQRNKIESMGLMMQHQSELAVGHGGLLVDPSVNIYQ